MLRQTLAPTTEPVNFDEAKNHLRIDHDADDLRILGSITTAREQAEDFTLRALVSQKWELVLDSFLPRIDIPLPPLATVDSVKYIDADGAEQTLAANLYRVVKTGDVAYIEPAYNTAWPMTRGTAAVTVAFTCGYTVAPARVKAAVLLYIQSNYDDDPKLIQSAEALLWPLRDMR